MGLCHCPNTSFGKFTWLHIENAETENFCYSAIASNIYLALSKAKVVLCLKN